MNILLTGSTGFIGRHVKSYLLKMGYNVYCLTREKKDDYDFEMDLLNVVEDDIEFVNNKNNNYDILIHMASMFIASEMNMIEEQKVFHSNLLMTENVIRIMNKYHIKKIVNFSSIAVYPNKSDSYSEKSEINMSNNSECMYGLSKFCSEVMLAHFLQGKIITNLRISQVYGQGMRDDRLMEIWKRDLLKDNQIEVWGGGTRTSNFISIDRLIELLQIFIEGDYSGVYNIGEKNLSYLEVADLIKQKYGNMNSKIIVLDKGTSAQAIINTKKVEELEREHNARDHQDKEN